MSRAQRESEAAMPDQDKDPRVQDNPDGEESGPEGTRDSRSAFRPLWDKGDPLPLVPRPEPPQRDLHAQRSQPCRMRPCRKRNAISSSYSSTGGFPWLKRRRGPDSSHCHVTLSSSETVSEDNSQAVSQAVIHTQGERAADTTPGEKLAPRNGSPTSQASRPRRRKFPLLPRRRGEPLMLPPLLKLGFRVTAEDLDPEKEAALRSMDSAQWGEAKAIWDCRASRPSQALSLPATGTSPAVPKAPSMDAQQETHKSQDSLGRVSLLASAAGAPSLPAVSGRKRRLAEPLPEQDKHPRVEDNPDGEESGPEGTRDSRSAFRPLKDNGDPLPLVPRPEPPQRDLHAQRSQPCRMRPCRKRNAVDHSYSSTGGFPWLKRRRGPDSSHCHVTLSSSETVSEDNSQAVSQAVIHTLGEKAADATPGEKLAPKNGSPTSQASRPLSSAATQARGASDAAPPLKLGFRVTAEDLDPEKEGALRSIYSALWGEAKVIWDCRASRPSQALSLPATGTSPAVPKAPSMDAQQETHKSQDSLGRVSLLASAAGAPSLPALSGRKRRSAGPLLSSDPLPATSSHSRDTAQCGPQPEKPEAWRFCCCSYHRGPYPLYKEPHVGVPTEWSAKRPLTSLSSAPAAAGAQSAFPASPSSKRIAVSGSGSSSAASTSAHLAPKAASDSEVTPLDPSPFSPPLFLGPRAGSGRSDAPQAQHSLRKGHHQPGRTEGLWSQPSTETSSTQPKPAVLPGQQEGTRTLKRSLLYSDLAAAAPASSAPRQPAQGTTAHSAAGVSSPATCTLGPPTEASRPGLLAQLGPFLRHLLPLPVRCMLPFTRCLCQN
ncbi:putative POM121-like protein 1 [Plecturocebus cupreus]